VGKRQSIRRQGACQTREVELWGHEEPGELLQMNAQQVRTKSRKELIRDGGKIWVAASWTEQKAGREKLKTQAFGDWVGEDLLI